MNSVGIYFGPKLTSIIEAKGKKIVNNIIIPQSAISAGELEEKVPVEVRGLEMVALLKEELRKNRIEAKEATICLSGKDLIIRTLEMPVLPREELKNAINFEAKKYIPFRVEDLVSDFQLKFDKISHTNIVLFVGIKKEVLDRYISIFKQLDIKINSIEYSAFSVLRLLRLAGSGSKGIVGILASDLNLEDETNFIVLEDGFPLFSRDIALTSGPEDLGKPEELGPGAALEKLKTEIRVSLDYYHRKFPTKNIKKIFFLSNQDYRLNLETIMTEIGLSGQFIGISKYIGKAMPYSLSSIKGYSSSLSRAIKTDLRLNLLAAKAQAGLLKEQAALPFLKGLKLDYRVAALGLLICIAAFGYGYYRMQELRKGLYSIRSSQAAVVTVNPETTYDDLTSVDSKYKIRLDTLDNLIKKQLYITELLDAVPAIMPKGAWLTKFSFSREQETRLELALEGTVYLEDSGKEFEAVNRFLADLKATPNFIKYFREINISSVQRKQLDKTTVTNFLILCRSFQERK
ncbi:MAG: pilus assembly protein PilM [Candidatus Omnitrophica bacterium]|nr:pilus assembly protein PilM [Candidatus Omnitrophota bacterium]